MVIPRLYPLLRKRLPAFFGAVIGGIAVLVAACQSTTDAPTVATAAAPARTTAPGAPVSSGTATPGPLSPVMINASSNPNNLPGQALISFPQSAAPAPTGAKPNITARCAILVDGQGRVLYEKDADMRVPTASTQKLLLGLMVVEKGDLSGQITIVPSDSEAEPTVMGLKAGQNFTRDELLRAVLIRSCNDIARALARDLAGSDSAFAAAANVRARQLGMTNSYFTNSNGLPYPSGQYSTARDMAILCAHTLRHPLLREIVSSKGMLFRFPDGTSKTITNTNLVLRNFPYCTGAKTGYTNDAGRCLVSSASANGRNVIAVILGSKSPDVWIESEALLRYGLGM